MFPWVKMTSAFCMGAAFCAATPDDMAHNRIKVRVITPRSLSHSRQRKHGKQNAPQPKIPPLAVEPLLQSVCTASRPAAADGNCFAAQRKRNVGIRRRALH